MLRRNPKGLPSRLGKRAAWTVAVLAAAACLAVAGVGPLRSAADDQSPAEPVPEAKAKPTADPHGDPLPAGALARLGTTRLRHGGRRDVRGLRAGRQDAAHGRPGQHHPPVGPGRRQGNPPLRPAHAGPQAAREGRQARADEKAQGRRHRSTHGRAGRATGAASASPWRRTARPWPRPAATSSSSGRSKRARNFARSQAPADGLAGLLFSPDGRTLAARRRTAPSCCGQPRPARKSVRSSPPPRPKQDGIVLIFGGEEADRPRHGLHAGRQGPGRRGDGLQEGRGDPLGQVLGRRHGQGNPADQGAGGVGVSAVAVAPGGKLLAYGAGDVVHLCAADTGKEVRQLKTSGGILALVFSPDGKTLAVRGRNQRVRLWETETGKELHQLGDAEAAQRGGGLTLSRRLLRPGDAGRWPSRRTASRSPRPRAAPSASGRRPRARSCPCSTAIGAPPRPSPLPRTARRWSPGAPTGSSAAGRRPPASRSASFPAPAGTTLAAFSADGRTVALANADNTIRLHDTTTGKELHRLKGHEGRTCRPGLRARRQGAGLARQRRQHHPALRRGARQRAAADRHAAGGKRRPRRQRHHPRRPARASRGTGPAWPSRRTASSWRPPAGGSGALSNALVLFDAATGKELRKIESLATHRQLRLFAGRPHPGHGERRPDHHPLGSRQRQGAGPAGQAGRGSAAAATAG